MIWSSRCPRVAATACPRLTSCCKEPGFLSNAHLLGKILAWAVALIASFQVPFRLQWKKDLQQLMPFNRKLLWVQSAFTVISICFFGSLTLLFHQEMLRGDRPALGIAAFIGAFWTSRVLVDAFYFSHADWPKGRQFVIGHICLTTLFVALAASYWGLLVWRLWLLPRSS